jgi:hypothetical protein
MDIIKGAVGLTKAACGIDPAPAEVVQARRDICRECPFATKDQREKFIANKGLTTFSRCTKCGCVIAAKTKIAGEVCPDGKWLPHVASKDQA